MSLEKKKVVKKSLVSDKKNTKEINKKDSGLDLKLLKKPLEMLLTNG
jgi:hypothetical protein